MRYLFLIIFVLFSAGCLDKEEQESGSGSDGSRSTEGRPEVAFVDVYVNGVLQGPPPIHMNVGDTITMTVNASDPNSLPLEYAFRLFQNCVFASTIQDFSSDNTMTGYTVTSADVNSCNTIFIGVRNNDGNDYDSTFNGDLQYQIPLNVGNGTAIPAISSVDVYVNGVLQGPPPINMDVGDTITMTVNASDPNSLPLEYAFRLFQNCGFVSTIQDFSANNTMAGYIATSADVNNCDTIFIGVRNNDGTDYEGSFNGDLQYQIPLNVNNGTSPPVLDSVDVYVNGVLQGPPPIDMNVGDTITMTVNASDPNALPLHYSFHLSRQCVQASTLQSFSPNSSMAGYTVVAADVNNCAFINIGVKNNDGTDYQGSVFGDLEHQIQLRVSQ